MAARTTMNELIEVLRSMTEAGTADWTLGTATYWDGDHIQTVLDKYRTNIYYEQLYPIEKYTGGGSVEYYDYVSQFRNFETTSGGTAVFWIEDSLGTDIGTASYTVDYLNGRITFSADTSGTVYYLTGRSYDLNAAAAEIWRVKAGHYATTAIDFSTDNHKFNQSQIVSHCREMANYYAGLGAPTWSLLTRSDVDVDPE